MLKTVPTAGASRIALLAGAGIAALAFTAPAHAQDAAGAQAGDSAQACADLDADGICDTVSADGSEEGGAIVVTGSRIRRPNFDTLEPITSVTGQYIETRGLTNVADALNELPTVRGSVTPDGAQSTFGVGVNFINSFGLGSNRTLSLINGRRVVSSNPPTIFGPGAPGLQVDLNIIPTILTERIDNLSVGGAPTYGSDAIAGVVNVVLKTRYEGIQLAGTAGISDRGDNFRYNLSGVIGQNLFDGRANITASLAYDKTDGVLASQRERSRAGLFSVSNPSAELAARLGPAGRTPANDGRFDPNVGFNESGADGVPGSVLITDRRINVLTRGGLIFGGPLGVNLPGGTPGVPGSATSNPNARQFDQFGNLVPFNIGTRFTTGGIDVSGGDGFTLLPFGQITSDLERLTANLFFNIDINDSVRFFAEGTYYNAEATELTRQPTYNAVIFVGQSAGLTFRSDNPFLTDQARAALLAAGVTNFTLSRAGDDIVTGIPTSKTDLYRLVGGFAGDFQLGGRDFNWEVSANYGRSDSSFLQSTLNQQRFANAVNVARDSSGRIVCTTAQTRNGGFAAPGSTPVADPNCVPLNLFGLGVMSDAARAYVTQDVEAKTRLDQFVLNANVGGSLFDIWGAGPIGFNIGAEYREEKGIFTPDAFQQAGLGRSVPIPAVRGDFNIKEAFGEILIPLISPANDFPIIHRAEIVGRGRYVDNSITGEFFAWTAGGAIAPIQDIELRGNYTRSFRAPSITELFSPQQNIFNFVPDLCTPSARTQGQPDPAIRLRNCEAFLAVFPNATPLDAASGSVPGLTGGNRNLDNEKANSYTFGAIVRPRFLSRFSASVDYINIEIEQPISSLNAAQITNACFDNPEFNSSDPANGNAFCSLIRRFPVGSINPTTGRDRGGQVDSSATDPGVRGGFVNGVSIEFEGIQFGANFVAPLDGIGLPGRLTLDGSALHVIRRLTNITGVSPSEGQGLAGDPEWAGQANIYYDTDDWGTYVSFNYEGPSLPVREPTADNSQFTRFPAEWLINAGVYFDIDERSRFTLSVTNLFDNIGTIPRTIDALGRRYSASFRTRF